MLKTLVIYCLLLVLAGCRTHAEPAGSAPSSPAPGGVAQTGPADDSPPQRDAVAKSDSDSGTARGIGPGDCYGAPVAISVAGGSTLQAELDPAFARAERFLVVDSQTSKVLQVVENAAANAARGAGVQCVDIMRQLGVCAVLSGGFGRKAAAGLRSLGIVMVEVPGSPTAAEALADYQQGKLSPR